MNTTPRIPTALLALAIVAGSISPIMAQGGRGRGGGRGAAPPAGATAATGAAAPAAAQFGNQGALFVPPSPDTMFGLTDYDLARQKLESLIKPTDYAVMVINDMEGLGGVVNNGAEMSPGRGGVNVDHQNFRQELTDETNAAIAGARLAGANKFFVVEGHGANNWHSTYPDKLDPEAYLVRGWPRPSAMQTGVNSKIKAILIVGNHPNVGTQGIIAHAYAFGSALTVNGRKLNESGISAFVAGEYGVPVAMGAGDDSYVAELPGMVGGPVETVVVKIAFSGSAGAIMPLARVHAQIKAAAARGIARVKSGEIKPTVFEKPYHVAWCLRSLNQNLNKQILAVPGVAFDSTTGGVCYTMVTSHAEEVTNVLNMIEWPSLKP